MCSRRTRAYECDTSDDDTDKPIVFSRKGSRPPAALSAPSRDLLGQEPLHLATTTLATRQAPRPRVI